MKFRSYGRSTAYVDLEPAERFSATTTGPSRSTITYEVDRVQVVAGPDPSRPSLRFTASGYVIRKDGTPGTRRTSDAPIRADALPYDLPVRLASERSSRAFEEYTEAAAAAAALLAGATS
jgi:hypothetical protein